MQYTPSWFVARHPYLALSVPLLAVLLTAGAFIVGS